MENACDHVFMTVKRNQMLSCTRKRMQIHKAIKIYKHPRRTQVVYSKHLMVVDNTEEKERIQLRGMKIFSSMERLKNGQQDKNKDMQKVRIAPKWLYKDKKEKLNTHTLGLLL